MGNIRFIYLRDSNRRPVGCIATRRDGDNLLYQLSIANPKDQFNKSLARYIATERLTEKPVALDASGMNSGHALSALVMTSLLNSRHTRAKMAAKLWLKRAGDQVPPTVRSL